MPTPLSICNLNNDILALICDAVGDEHVQGRAFNRPSVLAFSETCKLIRTVAAPIIFKTLVIWNWNSLCETSHSMRVCEHVRRFTRTLRVTPIIKRRVPTPDNYRPAWGRAPNLDEFLPQAGSSVHTGSQLHYRTRRRAANIPQSDTANIPLSSLVNGPHICVDEQAAALAELVSSFDNLTELIFGLGEDPLARPPFEKSLISALRIGQFDAVLLSKVTQLDIEDTALFWTAVCPNVQTLTLRLGYSTDGAELDRWHPVESVRNLRVFGAACLGLRPPERTERALGPALARALPNTTSLDLMGCDSKFETILDSLKDFTFVQHLHVHARLSELDLGFKLPALHCGKGKLMQRMSMNDEQLTAELESGKLVSDRLNTEKHAALNMGKRLVMSTFRRLQSLRIGAKIAYDFTQLQSMDLGELDRLTMTTDVALDKIY